MPRTTLHFLRFALLSSALCSPLLPVRLSAQSASGISGDVKDFAGQLIPNASVTIASPTGTSFQTTTDPRGHFHVDDLPVGQYAVTVTAKGFSTVTRTLRTSRSAESDIAWMLPVATNVDQVTVEANSSASVAAALAPMDGLLDTHSARTEINTAFVQNFTPPTADLSELVQMAPGTFSVASNGIGLTDSKTFFRGFPDGRYDVTFDGIPFSEANSPEHHSWAFFPSQWLGGVDFDRSPGSASTVGPTPFGGSINELSRDISPLNNLRVGVSYSSFNTILTDGQIDTGGFGKGGSSGLFLDVNHLTSDGYQTGNAVERNAGSVKYQLKISNKTMLTGFSGVLLLDANTPNAKGATRAQIAAFGDSYLLQSTDPSLANYTGYNSFHVPTDFEYVGLHTERGHGWMVDVKPYTYQYNNQQFFATQPKTGGINAANCAPVKGVSPCSIDKLNSYRKYGETSTISQVSRFGTFRTGLWYEWAKGDRHQFPRNPLTGADDVLPSFNEKFWTNSFNPYAEYEWHPTSRLTVTGGLKVAHYNTALTQFADNGKTVGSLGGKPFVAHSASYNAWLPSVDANYRLQKNWSIYGQFSTGSVIPPTSVFDTTGANTTVLPKPTGAKTYQGGSVLKLRRITLNLDGYYTHFQNAYSASPDPAATSATQFTQSGDSVSKGFEGETNIYLFKGLSLYANGTAGSTKYVSHTLNGVALGNFGQWAANTPANTESTGLTWQQRSLDAGFFFKRVGPLWQDGVNAAGATLNQVVPIDAFDVENVFVNYTVRNGSWFEGTKLRFSVSNLLDAHNMTSVTQAATVQAYTPGPNDIVGLLSGRSFSMTVTLGVHSKR
jgi:iron complex outermembrane receptor protein